MRAALPWLLAPLILAGACGDDATPAFGDAAPTSDTTADVGADTGPTVSPVTLCEVPTLDLAYPGVDPPDPTLPIPAAPPCVDAPHEVIIVLGCPSAADGSASSCQQDRAAIALSLREQGYGERFITSGGAVHNAFVEAEALRDLLVAGGVAAADVTLEPQAEHTDENLYYATQLMEAAGWTNALVVSDHPTHLLWSALCDANCCVRQGRLSVHTLGGHAVGHYALAPHAAEVSDAECAHIAPDEKLMCLSLPDRRACAGNLRL